MSAMYNFLFDKKSLALLIAGLVLGGGMLFFAGVLVGVYWSLPYGESIQSTSPLRRPVPPVAASEPVTAPPPAAPEPVAARPAPLATEPPIELPVGPPPVSETAPGPVAAAEESIGLPKTVPPPAPEPGAISEGPVLAVDSGEGRYTIQVGAYSEVANSEETVAQLSRRGYSPYVVEVHGARGVLHLVRVGRYSDRGTATRAASELRRKARMEAIVAPVLSQTKEAAPESEPAESGEKPATSG